MAGKSRFILENQIGLPDWFSKYIYLYLFIPHFTRKGPTEIQYLFFHGVWSRGEQINIKCNIQIQTKLTDAINT